MREWSKLALFIGLLCLGCWLISEGWFDEYLNREDLMATLKANSIHLLPTLILAGAIYTAIGGPRQVLAFVFGYSFGGWLGALFSTLVTLLGCIITMWVARFLLVKLVSSRRSKKIESLRKLLHDSGWVAIAAIRFFPFGSNVLTNILAGAANIEVGPMLVGSFIGYLPQMLIFSFAGAGIGWSNRDHLVLSGVLLLLSSAIGWFLYRKKILPKGEQPRPSFKDIGHG